MAKKEGNLDNFMKKVDNKMDKKVPVHNCVFCEKSFSFKSGLCRHVKKSHNGNKNGNLGNDDKKMIKKKRDWKCDFCDKIFVHQSGLCKHTTRYHMDKKMDKMVKNDKKMIKKKYQKQSKKNVPHWECEFCKKKYEYQSGLSRHKKKCEFYINKNKNNEKNDEILYKLMNIMKNNKNVTNNNCHNTTNNTTNNINNKININLYLNEDCKNALNLEDFVEKIKISLNDILNTKNLGYIDGMSKIFIKNLENLPQKERPVQCTEMKPLEYYVKNDNKWSKNGKINGAIGKITKKQAQGLKEWEKKNPKWSETEEGIKKWRKLQKSIMGSSEELSINNMNNEIIENVCESSKVDI